MCVIIHGLKKKHVRRAEVQEAMRSNPAGFFLAALKGTDVRRTVRTMDANEALKFFDETVGDDDQFVMHARIPSRGNRGLENVHGWEEDGIIFSHNMTLSSLDDMMRRADWKNTDSEFFFRRIFMPYFRGFGKDAYKDGKLHPDIVNLVEHFVGGTNKFCFIMPDNKVLRFGNWVNEPERKENGETAFWASNTTYRVYQASWPSAHVSGFASKGGSPQSGGGFCHQADPDYDEDYWQWAGHDGFASKPERSATASPSSLVGNSARAEEAYDGKTLRQLAGDAGVLRLALADMVCQNLVGTREVDSKEIPGEQAAVDTANDELLPEVFTQESYETVVDGLQWMPCADEDAMEMIVESYAAVAEEALCKLGNGGITPYFPRKELLERGLQRTQKDLDRFCRLMNLGIDYSCEKVEDFAVAFVLSKTRKGNFTMAKIETPDLIGNDEMTVEDAMSAVETILGYIECEEVAAEEAEAEERSDSKEKGGAA